MIWEDAFRTVLENYALQPEGEEVAIPNPDPEGPDHVYLTEYGRELANGLVKAWAGPRITARNLEHAEEVGKILGLQVLGLLTGEESYE